MQRVLRVSILLGLVVAGASVFLANSAFANGADVFKVNLILTPLGGGIFQYDITIQNDGAEDVSIVSITDAPLNDPLIDFTLTTPAGFLGSYDAGLGFVDFLEDTDLFGAGTTKSGFRFQSAAAPPANFTRFEALTTDGNLLSGFTSVIPEPGSALLVACGLVVLTAARRNSGIRINK